MSDQSLHYTYTDEGELPQGVLVPYDLWVYPGPWRGPLFMVGTFTHHRLMSIKSQDVVFGEVQLTATALSVQMAKNTLIVFHKEQQ